MATTTPNYGWPVPTNTDYVKDGANAISDLGDAIDATVFGLPAGGLSLINTTTATTATLNIDNLFTTEYKNYKIVVSITAISGGAPGLRLQLRSGGSTTTGSDYKYALFNVSTNAVTGTTQSNGTSSFFMNFSGNTNPRQAVNIDLNLPQENVKTLGTIQVSGNDTATFMSRSGMFYHDANAQFDGIAISSTTADTFTGTVSIYGYKN